MTLNTDFNKILFTNFLKVYLQNLYESNKMIQAYLVKIHDRYFKFTSKIESFLLNNKQDEILFRTLKMKTQVVFKCKNEN